MHVLQKQFTSSRTHGQQTCNMEVWAECLCACASVPVCLRLLCALCACVPCPRAINIVIDTYSLYAYEGVLLSASSTFTLEGPIRGGWVGPEWRGGVGPATLALMMMFLLFETMFYADRLHKLVAAQCACCSHWLGNAMRLFSTWVPGYP